MSPKKDYSEEVALIFVEGETEVEFYQLLSKKYLKGIPKRIINLHGNFNIHNKILDKTMQFHLKNPKKNIRIYCCIDRESRYHNPPLNITLLNKKFASDTDFNGKVLTIDTIIATQMIESWFFYDIEGIFNLLRVPIQKRKPKKFSPVEKLTHIDLSRLFKQHKKAYIKGKRCKYFVSSLNIVKIYKKCSNLRIGFELIIRRHKNRKKITTKN